MGNSSNKNINDINLLRDACVVSGDVSVVKEILSRNPHLINKELDRIGWTALHLASYQGREKIVQLLLSYPDININVKDINGDTALHRASKYGRVRIIKLLLSRLDIDINILTKDGRSAADICCESPYADKLHLEEILQLFKEFKEKKAISQAKETKMNDNKQNNKNNNYIEVPQETISRAEPTTIHNREIEPSEPKPVKEDSSIETLKHVERFEQQHVKIQENALVSTPSALKIGKIKTNPHNGDEKKYDVFLTHDWGVPETEYLNHRRVSLINQKLESHGLKTWFDEKMMEGNVRDKMTLGIAQSHCVIVFITQRYAEKINTMNSKDNCYFEFDFATQELARNKIIPAVLEESMRDTSRWNLRLKSELGRSLYVDMSEAVSPEMLSSKKTVEKKAMNEREEELLERKCKELVRLIYTVLEKPLQDLTEEQTLLFLRSIGCPNLKAHFHAKEWKITGEDLAFVKDVKDLEFLPPDIPSIKLRRIVNEIRKYKDHPIAMATILPYISLDG